MNINGIGFGAKMPISRIKMAKSVNNTELPVNNYVREMLEQHGAEIEKAASYFDRDVILAQRGNLLLANSGVKTSVIDMSKMKNGMELIEGIKNNLMVNKLNSLDENVIAKK